VISRTGLTLVWGCWLLGSLAIYLAGPITVGPVATLVRVWWQNWPFIVGFGILLTLLVSAVWLFPRMRR
jgi:hypothetical protein